MTETRTVRRNRSEHGSALLIVFLFAAILAISLYMEMPSVAFESKRAKEQLLVDRGHEYAHAVKLYYRKFRSYPVSIDALENTNRMRFLRHRFKDPMTGDDKWRLLHAGAAGQLTDSKVNPIGLNANGQNPANGTSSGLGNNSSNGSATPTNTASATNPAAANGFNNQTNQPTADNGGVGMVAGIPQRPPEMPLNGTAAASLANNTDPTQSLLQPAPGQAQAQQPGPAVVSPVAPIVTPGNPGQFANQAQAATGASAANPLQGVQGLFANPNPVGVPANSAAPAPGTQGITAPGAPGASPFSQNTATTQSGPGVIQTTGGIAGVASLAKGSSIKLVNDQSDYSLWEFYYDPTKDTSILGQSGINPVQGVNTQNGLGSNALSPGASASPNSTNSANPSTATQTPTVTPITPIPQQQP